MSPVKKYGPLAAIVVVIAVVAAIALTGGNASNTTASTSGSNDVPASEVPTIYANAKAAGTEGDIDWVDSCDKATGRIKVPSVYAPPCVPKAPADNGGAIGQGVTADTIKLVIYAAGSNDITALFTGVTDPPEATRDTENKLVAMFNQLYETYGRTVEVVHFQGTGAMSDETAATSDALKIADEIGAFAVINGPTLAQSFAQTLHDKGVLCLGCGSGVPDKTMRELDPTMWGYQASPEQFLQTFGDYVTEQLNNKPASFAGDELKDRQRVFGVVHFEQDPPVFGDVEKQVAAQGAKRGYQTAANETYIFGDFAKMQERAATIIPKLKEAGVTSIIFLGDPIMPIYLTQQATQQNYFPEWIITGTVLTDTTVLGRMYDQQQWKHAFGVSGLGVRQPRENGEGYRLYQWFYGEDPQAKTNVQLSYPGLSALFLGIHLAGPNLTPQTFRDGLFGYPPTGGGVTTPQISYGRHGLFKDPEENETDDFLGIDDLTFIWWDATGTGVDESGKDGTGVMRYAEGGKRYLPGTVPAGEPKAFQQEGSIALLTEVPADERPPDYPSPNGP
jgi:hypothetical protein